MTAYAVCMLKCCDNIMCMVLSISYCTHAKAITDIINRGKVGLPEQRSRAQPEIVRGYSDFPKVYNVGYCPSCVVQ